MGLPDQPILPMQVTFENETASVSIGSSAGLEEKQIAGSRIGEFLAMVGRRAPQGMTPVVIGKFLLERDSRYRALAGLEEQGIFLHQDSQAALFERLLERDVRAFLLAGLEEEARQLKPLAEETGMVIRQVPPGKLPELLRTLFSIATGLPEPVIQEMGYPQFLAGLEELASRA